MFNRRVLWEAPSTFSCSEWGIKERGKDIITDIKKAVEEIEILGVKIPELMIIEHGYFEKGAWIDYKGILRISNNWNGGLDIMLEPENKKVRNIKGWQ